MIKKGKPYLLKNKIVGAFSDRNVNPQDFETRNKKSGRTRKKPRIKKMVKSLQNQFQKETPVGMKMK